MSKNIGELFIGATKNGTVFSIGGNTYDIYDLWNLSPRALDDLYQEYNKALKEARITNYDSLFNEKDSAANDRIEILEDSLDIIRYIFNDKQAQIEAEKKATERKAQRNRIAELIIKKENEKFESLDLDSLRNMLDELD